MDRQIIKSGQIPLETDLLGSERSTMIALGWLLQGVLGTTALVDGLACTPSSPASMVVNVAPGQIFQLASVDASSYGSLVADTAHQIVKQGLAIDPTALTLTAPATSGQSQNYLVQVGYSDSDDTPIVRPYYNSANPAVGLSGPGGSGAADNTFRRGKCLVQIKAGAAAVSGTQATPLPDPGFIGIFAITVANGVTTVTSGNIAQLSAAPFIFAKLPGIPGGVQNGSWIYNVDTGAANTYVVAVSPPLAAYVSGTEIAVKIGNTNTGASTLNINGLGAKSIVRFDGSPVQPRDLLAGMVAKLIYDGVAFQLQNPSTAVQRLTASKTLFVRPDGSDLNDGSANTSASAFATITGALAYAASRFSFAGYGLTIQLGIAGTYAPPGPVTGVPTVSIIGDPANQANYIISGSVGGSSSLLNGSSCNLTISGVTVTNTGVNNGWISAGNACSVAIDHITFNDIVTSSSPILACGNGGSMVIGAGCIFSACGAAAAMSVANGGSMIQNASIALAGGSGFASFVTAVNCGVWSTNGSGYTGSGTVTGPRFNAIFNGVISVNGAGPTALPGSSAGSVSNGGQYA